MCGEEEDEECAGGERKADEQPSEPVTEMALRHAGERDDEGRENEAKGEYFHAHDSHRQAAAIGSDFSASDQEVPRISQQLLLMSENVLMSNLDPIDRDILRHLVVDGRATYQELSKAVRLSANTVADRVRRLRSSGVILDYRAQLDPVALGRPLAMVSEIRLGETVVRRDFEVGLVDVPQVVSGSRLTGDYDYELRLACRDASEFESIVDRLRQHHGVVAIRSRMVLHDLQVDPGGMAG